MDIKLKEFEIGNHKRLAVIVTTRNGYCYWINSAEPFPTEAEAKELWKTDRKSFLPYYGQVGY